MTSLDTRPPFLLPLRCPFRTASTHKNTRCNTDTSRQSEQLRRPRAEPHPRRQLARSSSFVHTVRPNDRAQIPPSVFNVPARSQPLAFARRHSLSRRDNRLALTPRF